MTEFPFDLSKYMQFTDDVWYGPDQRPYNYMQIINTEEYDLIPVGIYREGQCTTRSVNYVNNNPSWLYCYVG